MAYNKAPTNEELRMGRLCRKGVKRCFNFLKKFVENVSIFKS